MRLPKQSATGSPKPFECGGPYFLLELKLVKVCMSKLPVSKKITHKTQRGFTLIEILIASAVITIAGVVIIATIASFLRVVLAFQDTTRAQNLANEKLEILKNMPYASLATQFGAIYPPGNLPDTQTVTSGGHQYVVHTYINFVDDSFDGNALGTIPGKPQDFYPFDYKKITIEVRDGLDKKAFVKINTNIAANAAETSDNTGILFVSIVDSQGNPVSNANVHLTNPNPSPDVDITTITDTAGLLQIPLLPQDTTNGYHIVVSLTGYSTDGTYPDSLAGYDPVQPDFNILSQQVTNLTYTIDRLGSMNITVQDENGNPLNGVGLTVASETKTYVDTNGINPDIAKYSQTFTSGPSGQIAISNLEWGGYGFSPQSGHYITSVTPYQPVSLTAAGSLNVTLSVSTNSSWPIISSVTPTSGLNNASLSVEVIGTNLVSGSSIELRLAGQPTIVATGVVSSGGDTDLTGNFDLTGALTGTWDLAVVKPGGQTTIQKGGFTVANP